MSAKGDERRGGSVGKISGFKGKEEEKKKNSSNESNRVRMH